MRVVLAFALFLLSTTAFADENLLLPIGPVQTLINCYLHPELNPPGTCFGAIQALQAAGQKAMMNQAEQAKPKPSSPKH